jgi:tetratricopeptide (TPR) repeat protein
MIQREPEIRSRSYLIALATALFLAAHFAYLRAAANAFPSDAAFDRLERCVISGDRECIRRELAKAHDPNLDSNPEYLDLKARGLMLLHRKEEALKVIERAIQADPQEYRYRMTEGRMYQNFGTQALAIRSFLLADRLQPRSPETFYSLGMSFFILGEYDKAAKHFRQTLELDPKFDRAEFMLGINDMIHFRLPAAKRELEEVLAMQPKNSFYHLYYGILLDRMASDPSALHELQTAKSLNPSYALTRFNLGRLLRDKGDYQAARTELEAAVRLRANFSAAYYQLGWVYRRLGMEAESQKAYEAFRKAKAEEDREAKDPVESVVSQSARPIGPS